MCVRKNEGKMTASMIRLAGAAILLVCAGFSAQADEPSLPENPPAAAEAQDAPPMEVQQAPAAIAPAVIGTITISGPAEAAENQEIVGEVWEGAVEVAADQPAVPAPGFFGLIGRAIVGAAFEAGDAGPQPDKAAIDGQVEQYAQAMRSLLISELNFARLVCGEI